MSNLPTVNVTARVYDQSGKPIHKAVVTMRLTTVERYSGYIVPREVRAETDAAGKAVLAVWPNELGTESSEYRVHIKYPHNGCESSCFNGGSGSVSGYAVVPNHDCDLQDIMELSPYEQRGAGQVITSEVAMYAGQASAARDAAQSHAQSAQASIGQVNAAAEKAEAAKTSAQIAAELATAKAGEAGELVQRANERIVYFESEVTQRVETETNRLTTAATTVITESRNDALNQIEQRTTQSIMEVTSNAATLKADAVEAVTRAEARAVDALDKGVEDGLRQFHEEGELFKEDFEQLTERAESAAKKAGCASLSAQSHANRACECAKAAELAAETSEAAQASVLEAARAAELSKTCAEAAAARADAKALEIANRVHDAEDAAKTAERAASAARQDALSAAQSNQAAAVARDEAMQSAEEAAQSAAASKADADRAEEHVGRVEEEIKQTALDILTPQVVTEAVAKATEKATESAGLAQIHAEDAQFAANDARNTAVICKNTADRAVEAKDACEDLAARFLHDYQVESATVELSAQMVRLADRVTRVELDHINIPHGGDGNPSPGGYELAPGVRVVPLTVVDDAVNAPVTGAALTAVVDDCSQNP